MPKTRTAAENAAHWIAQAERYEREAERQLAAQSPANYRHWLDKATAARAKAATYTTPAP